MPRLPVTKNGVPVEPEDFSWRHPSVDDPLHVRERRVNFPMSRVEVLSRLGYFIINRALPGLEDISFDIQAEAPPIILENALYALTTIITGPTAASLMCAVTYLRHESVHPIVFFEGVDRVNERARSMLRYLRRHGIAIGYAEAHGNAMLYMYLLCDRDQDAYALMNTIQASPRRVCVRQLHEWLHYATDEIPKRVLDKIGRPFANLPVAKMVELPFSQKKQAAVERRTSSRPPKPTSLVAQRALVRADMLAGYGEHCDSEGFDDLAEPFRYTPSMSPSPARSHTADFAMPAPVNHPAPRPDLESRSSVASPAVAPAPMRVGKKRSRSSDAGSRGEPAAWAASDSVQALRHDLRSAAKAMQDMTRALHSTGQLMASCAQHAMLLPLWSTVAMQQGMPAMAGVTVPPDTSLCGMPEGASASGIAPDPFTNMMMLYQRMLGMSSASQAGSSSPDATPGIQLYHSGADLQPAQDAAAWHSSAGGAYGEPGSSGGDGGRPRTQTEQDLTVREEDGKLVYGGGRSHIKRVEMPLEDVDATSDEYPDLDEQDEQDAGQADAGKAGRRGAAAAPSQDDAASQHSGATDVLGSEDGHSMDDEHDEEEEEEEEEDDDDALGLNVGAADEEFVP